MQGQMAQRRRLGYHFKRKLSFQFTMFTNIWNRPDSAEVFNRFVDLGKAIPRLIHPFRSAHLILNAGQVTAEQRITDAAGNPLPAE